MSKSKKQSKRFSSSFWTERLVPVLLITLGLLLLAVIGVVVLAGLGLI